MSGDHVSDLTSLAIEILTAHPEGIAYRDFVQLLAQRSEATSRNEIIAFVADLPKAQPQSIWRPKPGYFALRREHDVIRKLGRPRKDRSTASQEPRWPAKPMPNRIENLTKLGFTEVGFWLRTIEGIECRYTSEFDVKKALFAYVLNGNVVYIGRLRGKGAKSGVVLRAIRTALAQDRAVQVFALYDWDECEHRGMPVNVAAGIEEELIERMQPAWNQSND